MTNLEINDIFPLVDVPDNSVYIFFYILFISLLCTGIMVRFLYIKLKIYKNKKKKTYIKILKNCDFKNAKDSSYKITYYTRLLIRTDKEKELFDEIQKDISLYKYQKNVPEISQETKERLTFLLNTIENNYV